MIHFMNFSLKLKQTDFKSWLTAVSPNLAYCVSIREFTFYITFTIVSLLGTWGSWFSQARGVYVGRRDQHTFINASPT